MAGARRQGALFELPPRAVDPAASLADHRALAAELPRAREAALPDGSLVRLGGMSWTYLGWRGLVYDERATIEAITESGLLAYAKHPLLRLVEIDRTYYEPLAAPVFARFAAQVPDDFRFVVKAHEAAVVTRWPLHPRYGKQRGEENPLAFDGAYAAEQIVGPAVEGLGAKLGALLFQFPPQDASRPRAFADRLFGFLDRLPRGPVYAVELRNAELLSRPYLEAIVAAGAVHCHNVWASMPDAIAQARIVPPSARSPIVVRWLLRRGASYEEAGERFAPFDRLVEEDVSARDSIARLVARGALHDVPSMVLVANHAEGCAPESIARLARSIVAHRAALGP